MAAKEGKTALWKKLVLVAAGLVVLFFLAALIAPMFIPWEKVRVEACKTLSTQLKHEVKVDSVSFSIFSGVRLKNVRVGNAAGFSADPLFSNQDAQVKYSLLGSLLARKAVITIKFIAPNILIEKNAQGVYNFSDMTGAPKAATPAAPAAPAAKTGPVGELPVAINSLVISKANFVYKDYKKGTTNAVKDLNFELTGFSLSGGGDSRLKLDLVAQTEGKKIPVDLSMRFKLDLGKDILYLKDMLLKLPSVQVSCQGQVESLMGSPKVDVNAEVDVKLASILDDLVPPSMLKTLPKGIKAKGEVKLNAQAQGAVADPVNLKALVKLAFSSVGVTYGTYPALEGLNGSIEAGPTLVQAKDLKFSMGGSPVNIELKVSDYTLANLRGPLAGIKAKVLYKITSPKLVLDPVAALAGLDEETPDPTEAELAKAAAAPEPPPLNLAKSIPAGVSVDGAIGVDSIQMYKLATGKLVQTLKLANQKAVVDLNLDVFRGSLAAHVEANLVPPGASYAFNAALKGLKAEDAVNGYADSYPKKASLQALRNKVFGTLSFEAKGTGKGLNGKAIKRNLDMKGHFKLAQGKFAHLDMQEKLASVIPHEPTKKAITMDITFDRTESDFAMSGGKASWSDFITDTGADGRGGNLMIQSNGWMKPGADVDFHVIPHFNPAMVNLGALQDAFGDDKGWATYDVEMSGPTMAKARPDFLQGAKKAATKVINKKIDEAKQKAVEEGTKKAQDLLKDKGGDMLKGLFGK